MTTPVPAEPTNESSFEETKTYLEHLRSTRRTVSIRQLIGFWGYKGRGKKTIQVIARDLAEMGMRLDPPLDSGPLDARVSVSRLVRSAEERAAAEQPANHLLTLARIESASFALQLDPQDSITGFVGRQTNIADAVTIMMRHDFSQLPVVDEDDQRTVLGIFTWEGYAQARLRGENPTTVGEASVPVKTVDLHSDLFASVASVSDDGYLVVTFHGALAGIVTSADLTLEFRELALPFLSVGRCERELKRVAKSKFAPQLKAAKKNVDEFMFGSLQKLYADHWDTLGWSLARDEFIDWLDATRRLRNSIAHFDDEQDTDLYAGIDAVHRLTEWLRSVKTSDDADGYAKRPQ